ncbi:FecR family protein [Filimonas effusa]|nr:FecR domain-containing protein [Filimonas effusa]
MQEDKHLELHRLMTDEIFGTPPPEDSQRLNQLLREPWARREWITFRETFKDPSVVENINRLVDSEMQEAAGAGLAKTIRKRKHKRQWRRAAVSSTLVIAAAFGWMYLGRAGHMPAVEHFSSPAFTQNAYAGAPAMVTPALKLQLANGQTIDLAATAKLNAGTATLYNDTAQRMLWFSGNNGRPHQLNTLIVPPGLDYHVRLSDGTEVFLNATSLLSFPFQFGSGRREIFIEGEAFVKVAPATNQPFIVHLPATTVEALGTAFNINTYDSNKITVSLQQGCVRLNTPGQPPVKLEPGMQAVVHNNAATTVRLFGKEELSWTNGAYTMDNTPLGALANVLPRWFGIKVVFDRPSLREERFTGTLLKKEPLASFLSTLERTANVKTYYDEGILHIQ